MTQQDVIDEILESVIAAYKTSPIDLLGINDGEGEYNYIESTRTSYARALRDIMEISGFMPSRDRPKVKVLEIGAFLGVLSVALARMGFSVTASDIPEFGKADALLRKYVDNDIDFEFFNLREYQIPFESESYDLVVMCATLEHLNFNPIPVLYEINRILKKDGSLYLTLPNIASLNHRISLLKGRSIHYPIKNFFAQLDRNDNMIVGIHWREYSTEETRELLENTGFSVTKQYLYSEYEGFSRLSLKNMVKQSIRNLFPATRDLHVAIARKEEYSRPNFYLCEANK